MKKPHWIRRTHFLRADEYICSECGAKYANPHPSCPNCGTRIGKTKSDGRWIIEAELLSEILDDDDF